MTGQNKDLVVKNKSQLSQRFAERFGVDSQSLMESLKATAFKQRDGSREVSDAQMIALLVVSEQYGLNPFTKEIYAYPSTSGIIPVVGVDGWTRIINEHPQFDGMEFNFSNDLIEAGDKTCPEWMEVVIYRKDRSRPITVREYAEECYRKPIEKKGYSIDTPWQSHPKRMLRHKTIIQGGRVAFGFGGIYDEDEAERVKDAEIINVQTIRKPNVKKPKPKPEPVTESKPEPVTEPKQAEPEKQPEPKKPVTDEMYTEAVTGIMKQLSAAGYNKDKVALELVKKGFMGNPFDASAGERTRVIDILNSLIENA